MPWLLLQNHKFKKRLQVEIKHALFVIKHQSILSLSDHISINVGIENSLNNMFCFNFDILP